MELMEAGLKEIGEKMIDMETKVSRKLAELDEKMKYIMTKLPPMDEVLLVKPVVGFMDVFVY
ncbi:unnamed protein product [Arabis nemorensis]|uniref:Uncharacterized protein n=1 Tax=Arabis nemorensis TaxID=586526 RepID=A0A565CDH4_9BRAS|nr:unnamed protein product [Arabis nemorensis]